MERIFHNFCRMKGHKTEGRPKGHPSLSYHLNYEKTKSPLLFVFLLLNDFFFFGFSEKLTRYQNFLHYSITCLVFKNFFSIISFTLQLHFLRTRWFRSSWFRILFSLPGAVFFLFLRLLKPLFYSFTEAQCSAVIFVQF